jgi:hypothetical protein
MSLGFVGGPSDHAELRRPAAAVEMHMMMPRVNGP